MWLGVVIFTLLLFLEEVSLEFGVGCWWKGGVYAAGMCVCKNS